MSALFADTLRTLGWSEGANLEIVVRATGGDERKLPLLADELLGMGLELVVASNTQAAEALFRRTRTVPIVISGVADPIGAGLISSLARPGGNVTGCASDLNPLAGKFMQFSRELVPGLRSIAFLTNPKNPTRAQQLNNMQAGTARLGLKLHTATAAAPGELEDAFAAMTRSRSEALVIGPDPVFTGACKQLAALAARHSLPAVYFTKEFPAAGGLASYGSDANDSFRRAGAYAGRILKGEKPGNLPVIQPTKFELVINLKTAKALGLKISQNMLARTDEVIQ